MRNDTVGQIVNDQTRELLIEVESVLGRRCCARHGNCA
jgi:hypothetical protein